jgi:hypothetical protein
MTPSSGGDGDYVPLLGLSSGEIYRRIHYAVTNVRYLVQYVQNPHLHLHFVQILSPPSNCGNLPMCPTLARHDDKNAKLNDHWRHVSPPGYSY